MKSRDFFSGLLVLLLFATLFRIIVGGDALEYRGHETLHFSGSGCSQEEGRSHVFDSLKRIATWSKTNPSQRASCSSTWFSPQGSILELAVAGYDSAEQTGAVYLQVESEDGRFKRSIALPLREAPKGWRVRRIHLEENHSSNARFRINVVDHSADAGWAAVRNRVNFYSAGGGFLAEQEGGGVRYLVAALALLGAVLASLTTLSQLSRWNAPALHFLFFFCCASLIHIRPEAFFHMDDWALLERFQHPGVRAVFEAHNEHVIPLSLSILFLEIGFFGENYVLYQIVSCLILAANGLLIRDLSKTFFPNISRSGHTLVAYMYVICGLHAEVVQWMICQTTLLSTFFILLSLKYSREYCEKETRGSAIIAAFAATAAPLCAAWGFVLTVLIPLVLFIPAADNRASLLSRQRLKALLFFTATSACSIASVALLYISFRSGVGHTLETFQAPNIRESLECLFAVSLLSVVLRGLGLLPVADTRLSTLYPDPEVLGFLGLSIMLILGVVFLRQPGRYSWRKLLLVLGIVFAPVMLVALGRSPELSLTFRYSNLSLAGLFLLLLPSVHLCSERLRRYLLGAFILSQVFLSISYRRYYNFGSEMQRFLARYAAWQELPAAARASAGDVPIVFGGDAEYRIALLPILHPAKKLELLEGFSPTDRGSQ